METNTWSIDVSTKQREEKKIVICFKQNINQTNTHAYLNES